MNTAIERSNALKEAGDDLGAQRILTRAIEDLKSFGDKGSAAREKMRGLVGELEKLTGKGADVKVGVNDKPFQQGKDRVIKGVEDIDGKRGRATADLDDNPFTAIYGNVKGRVRDLDGEKPTPHAFLAADPFFGTHQRVMGDLNVADRFTASPTVNLIDHASSGRPASSAS